MSTFKTTIFGVFLLFTLASGTKCPQEDVAKLVVCYYKSETSLSNFNICSCTHVVFTNAVKKGENSSLNFNEGTTRNLDLIKKKKDDILALFTLEVKSEDASVVLKSGNRSNELITGVAALLKESKFNGVELNFKFSSEDGVSKEYYVSFVKKLSTTLSSAHVRVKREGYDVFEKVQDDVTTAAYTTQTPKNSTSRTQSISIRNETKKSRNTREDRDRLDQTDKIPLEEDRSKEFPFEKPTESELNKDIENEESKFLIFLRLSIEPEIIVKKFDLKLLSRYADALLVPTHNIVSKNEEHLTYHPSRLMGLSDMLNTDSVVDFLVGMGAPKSKIVIIMPVTVLKFQLKDDTKNTPRSPTASKAQVMDQSQLCSLLSKSKNWTIERDDDLTAPYAYSGKTWLAFEDETSIGIKGKYILLRELAGGAVYPIDADTNDGSCANRTRSGFLVQTLYRNFQNLGRKPRALVLENLQEEIHSTGFAGIEAGVKQSEYRIVRVIDHSGTVHVIRRNTKTQFECSRQGYFSHPLGCNKFYRCVKFDQYSDEFTVFEYDCPAGLAFDERWEVCVWPGSLPHGAPCTGSSEIAPVPRSHYRCPNQEGYYADLENCRWFFACLDHARDGVTPLTAYEFRCPFGLVFNEDRLACDWPWLVGACGNRGAASFLKTHTTFINGGDLAASSGQFGSLEKETTFHGFGREFESGLKSGRGQSAGFGYIASGVDDIQNRASSFGSFPDYEISGGRIFNKEGVILEQHIVGLDSSSGKPGGSLHAKKEGLNIIPGSTGAANKQSGILYHRNSQSSYGRGSISMSPQTINIPIQNKFTEHPTVVGNNNLLIEFGQAESYRGDASFQDAVTTPKPFPAYIPSVQINQEQAYTGRPTAAGNTLLSAEFGQKQDIRDFDKISVLTATAKPLGLVNAVPSGGSIISSTAFSVTPTSPTFKVAEISKALKSKGPSFGNEDVGKASSITFEPDKDNFEYSSVHGLHDVVGIQGVQLEQSFDTRPRVSISPPFSLSTTPTPSSSKTIDHNFRYSSEHTSGIPVTIGVKKPSVLGVGTSKQEVHSFEQISAGGVQVQDFGQGVHFGTPQSSFKSITNGVSGKLQTASITDEYSFANGNIEGFNHPGTPKPVQGTLSLQQVAFGQSGVSHSTPVSFITTPKTPGSKPVEVSLSQPAITGRPFEHPSDDVNFSGSITSIPGINTFDYSLNSDKEASAYGHGVFGQKFDIQSKVPISAVRPPASVNIVGSQAVTHSSEGYSDSIGISGSTTSNSGLNTFEDISSYPIYGQSLGRKSFVGTASHTGPNENLRPVADGGRYSFQHTNHVETLNTLQPSVKSPGFTSVLGKQNTQDVGGSQSVGLQQGTPTKPALFSSTLRPSAFKINKQSTPSAAIEYPSDKLTSVGVISSDSVISGGIQPVDVFEQTQLQSGKKDREDQPVSFVFAAEPLNFKSVGLSLSQNGSQIINTESTAANPHFFEFTSGQRQESIIGEQNIGFRQRPTAQPISFSTSVPFGTTLKPQNFKSLKVSVSQPVSGYSDLHIIPKSDVRNIESSQNFNTQDIKVSQQFTPTGEVYPHESELSVSGQKSVFKTTGSSNGKQGAVNVLSTQFVTPAVQIFKNTGSSFYSYQQSQNQPNNFQQNVDAKVANDINLNEGLTYGIPIKNSESGLFDGKFNAERTSTVPLVDDTLADSPTHIPLGQQFSYSSFNRDGFASSRKVGATSNQQEILTELSIEQQPIVSIGAFQRSSTSKPNILSQGVSHVNVLSKTDINYQQEPFGENDKLLTPPATLQPELVSVTKSKTYSPLVTSKTDISKPDAKVVPFASLGREQLQEKFPFLGSQVNEFKAREELTGLEITKSIELNPHQFYQPTPRPIVVQQQPVHVLPQKTYSFGVIQPIGKVQSEHQASVSSTPLPAGYSTVKTTLNKEFVGLTNDDDGVAPGLFKPNVQLKNNSPFISQTGQLQISQEEGAFVRTQKTFDFQKIKSAEKISLQPQTVFRSQNATKFSINPNIEIPEPPKEYLAQYTTQSSTPSAKAKFKSSTYFPPENDNPEQIQNSGRFGQVIKERGSTYGYKSGSTTQKPRFRGRQYHGSITSNQKATNKYEEYDINGLGRSDSKTTIDLTNLKVDKDKKTVIIVSQVSDANPVLIGKLAGQCSCQSNVIELKTKGKKSSERKYPQITNEFLPPIETGLQRDASTPETVIIDSKAATTPQPDSSTILSSLSPDGVLTITPKSVYAGSLKKKQFRGRSRYLQPSEDLLSAVPASEIASTVDYASARNEIDGRGAGAGAGAGAAFDRYGPGGWRSFDETLQGSVDCKRPGLFRHPKYCNKFYSCNYDPWKERYMLHVFNCPIHLAYDSSISACNWPVTGPACADDNLLV